MRQRPILFNGPMVRAILAGRKTQTRRCVTGAAFEWLAKSQFTPDYVASPGNDLCPFGQAGDRLWVRETWMDLTGTGIEHWDTTTGKRMRYAYGAQSPRGSASDEARKDFGLKWRPSIHMPRAACRLVLEITGLRIERLQGITPADALAEGAMEWAGEQSTPIRDLDTGDERIAFSALWDSTGGSWDTDPWVWVIEFKRIDP